MSERCPGCRRTVAASEARCPRCGTSLLGVELEGSDIPIAGTEVVIGGRTTGDRRPPRRVVIGAVVAALAVIAGIAVVGRDRSTTSTTGTTMTTSTTVAGSSTSTSTSVADTTSTEAAATTTTTIDRRTVRSDDGGWEATIVHSPGAGTPVLGEGTGLTMADTVEGQVARFTDLDTGGTVTVTVSILTAVGGGQYTNPQIFPGGAVLQVITNDPPLVSSLIVYSSGEIRSPADAGSLVDNWYDTAPTVVAARTRAWFRDRADPHRLHLVDLASAATLRSVTMPAVSTAVGVDGEDPVVADPAGRRFTLGPDGSLRPNATPLSPYSGAPVSSTVRRVDTQCDASLSSCTQVYVDETGRRWPLLDADRALSAAAVPSPAGAHLVALLPATPCDLACTYTGPTSPSDPSPLEVVDLDRGTTAVVATTSARAIGGQPGQFGYGGGVTWSLDGRWLFFPVPTSPGTLGAWRPGLMRPYDLDLPSSSASSYYGMPPPVFFPTPAPAPTS